MNKSILMGRLTRDPDMRTTPAQVAVATFTLAVDRKFKNAAGEKQADFIPVVAWRNNAEFAGKYLKKGSKILLVGTIQTRTYDDKEGRKVYVTEIVADEMEFAESKRESIPSLYSPEEPYINIEEDDIALPFDL